LGTEGKKYFSSCRTQSFGKVTPKQGGISTDELAAQSHGLPSSCFVHMVVTDISTRKVQAMPRAKLLSTASFLNILSLDSPEQALSDQL